VSGGDGSGYKLIWVFGKSEYFCKGCLTLICPTGKSRSVLAGNPFPRAVAFDLVLTNCRSEARRLARIWKSQLVMPGLVPGIHVLCAVITFFAARAAGDPAAMMRANAATPAE
jgi:hypothetical protein